jgi:uncharacterized protein (AIM24 family)
MDHQIIGTVLPVLEMKLDAGESVVAESGELSWMTSSIELSTAASFATRVPGQILPVEVGAGNEYMIHRSGYLCGVPSVELSIGFQQKIGAGLFGGAGFILQKVAGTGNAWVELDGEIVEYELAAGESIRVHPGHVGMFHTNVAFELDRIKGIKNIVFGGDGIFLAKLTGPGHVWLQTLPLSKLAQSLIPYLPEASSGDSKSGFNIGNLLDDN